MNILLKVSIFVGVFLFLGGCTLYDREVIKINPSYNKVVIFNNSQYTLQEDGIFNRSIDPGETAQINIPCYGRFEGLLTAYRVVGTRKNGSKVLEYYGQRRYSVYVDGKNYVYSSNSNISVDYYREFR